MDHSKLFEIGLKKRNGELTQSWQELAHTYSDGLFTDGESYRCWVKNRIRSTENTTSPPPHSDEQNFKEIHEIHKDGTQSSNKLVKMSIEQSKDPSYLLKAHGFDPSVWELVSARNNIWNAYSQKDGILQLYSSKITVKPATSGFSFDKLLEEIRKTAPTYVRQERKVVSDKRLLEIPFFDAHFGVSNYDYYKKTQEDTLGLIKSRHWEETIFVIGQDMLHNDNFRGQTSSGTQIEVVDMPNAWSDAKKFYYPLIEQAIEHSNKVKIIYSKGNHDESMSWAFVQLLKERFPQVEFDDSFIERKAHTFGKNFIGVTHGDKARKNLHNLFQVEFPMQWATSTTREIHDGHLHTEDAKDYFGMMVRTLATRNKTDRWHHDNGYVGAHKRFMLFEYDESELKSIHYV